MSDIHILFTVPPECEHYLESSARIRGVSRTQLLRRMMELVLRDQMFLSILDDGDRPGTKTALVKRSGPGRPIGVSKPPPDRLFDAVRSHSVPTRSRQPTLHARPAPKTRSEQLAELQQAVLNTGGELVK